MRGPQYRDFKIAQRAHDEIVAKCLKENRCFGDEVRKIGCNRGAFTKWGNGEGTPNATFLAEMVRLGYDIIYILTGRRTK
jgi:hypothetical protein